MIEDGAMVLAAKGSSDSGSVAIRLLEAATGMVSINQRLLSARLG